MLRGHEPFLESLQNDQAPCPGLVSVHDVWQACLAMLKPWQRCAAL